MDFTYKTPQVIANINDSDKNASSVANPMNLKQTVQISPLNGSPATHYTTMINNNPVISTNNLESNTKLSPTLNDTLADESTSNSASTQITSQQTSQNSSQEDTLNEIEILEKQVRDAKMPIDLEERALRYIERLRKSAKRGSYTGEFESIEKYIYWITKIPWGAQTKDNLEINNAKALMNESHYGMDVVKNLILDYLAVMQMQQKAGLLDNGEAKIDMAAARGNSANAPVLLFTGLQGVGKTSIAKSIARAMGRKFIRISMGAIGDVKVLRGSPRGYPDSEPGQIVKALVRTGSMNPVILLDEIEKSSGNASLLADVMAALLEILDPEQNATFVDHYIDYPVDLSKVFFICTSNNLGSLSAALLDRMEVIRFTSYSDSEKEVIAKNYAFPKVIKNAGLKPDMIQLTEDAWPILIRPVGFDAGLRQLERNLSTLVRSAARKILEGAPVPVVISPANIREFVLPDQGPLS